PRCPQGGRRGRARARREGARVGHEVPRRRDRRRPEAQGSRAARGLMASDFEAQVRATNDKINARTGRPLLTAILVGLVLGGSLLDRPLLTAILVGLVLGGSLLVSLLVIKELYMVFAAVLIGFATFELASALRFASSNVAK